MGIKCPHPSPEAGGWWDWVEILLIASGRKLNSNWFKHKGNLMTQVINDSSGINQIQVRLDAVVTKLS